MAPVHRGLVESAEEWPWSSAAHHGGRKRIPGLTEHPLFWRIGNTPFEREANYRQVLQAPSAELESQQLERAALHGWALGSPEFIESIARIAPRRVSPLIRGRKPRSRRTKSVDLSPK
jgi:putative transposase